MDNQSNKKSFSLLKKISRKNFKAGILRYAITVFSCVLIIVMGAGILAYASATTIGENIITNILTATGLTVNGNATTTGNQIVSGNLEVGGNATTTGNQIVSGDLTVSGTTALATTTMATTTISALSSINGNIIYVQPGETIQSVIGGITDASATNPYTVMVPPGVYTEQITMRDYVSLQGSGKKTTIITWHNFRTPILRTANQISIQSLSLIHTNGGYCVFTAEALYEQNVSFNDLYIFGWHGIVTKKQMNPNNGGPAKFNIYNSEFFSEAGIAIDSANSIVNVFNSTFGPEEDGDLFHGVFVDLPGDAELNIFNCEFKGKVNKSSWGVFCVAPNSKVSIYNSKINLEQTLNTDFGISTSGIGAYEGETCMYGGSINTTGEDFVDIEQMNTGIVNVYGAKYNTSSGTIGGTQRGKVSIHFVIFCINFFLLFDRY